MTFEYEYIKTQEEVRKHIRNCEGRHTQQAIYSTFHDGLTQVCYGCKKIRTTITSGTSKYRITMQENTKPMQNESKPQDNIELKKKFEHTFICDDDWDNQLFQMMPSGRVIANKRVWDFFSPHLKDDNKIRREIEGLKVRQISGFYRDMLVR